MKTIYLKKGANLTCHRYENLEALKAEFKKREISVGNSCIIGDNCTIGNYCTLGDYCIIHDNCTLGNCCTLGYRCILRDNCTLSNYCTLGSYCMLLDGCTLGNNYTLGNSGILGDGVHIIKGFYLTGSIYNVTYTGNGYISIGYLNMTIEDWKKHGLYYAEREQFSKEEIEEYKGYLELCQLFHEKYYKK